MTWQYADAVIHGNKQNPQRGDYVIPRIHEADVIAAELAEWEEEVQHTRFEAAYAQWDRDFTAYIALPPEERGLEPEEPQPEDFLLSQAESDTKEAELEAVHSKSFTWTYDGKQTKAQFVAMVKGEVKAHIQHLNRALPEDDVSDLLRPEV